MALIWGSAPSRLLLHLQNPNPNPNQNPQAFSLRRFPSLVFPFSPPILALRATGTEGGSKVSGPGAPEDPSLLRRPLATSPPPPPPPSASSSEVEEGSLEEEDGKKRRPKAEEWVDWEDQILEDTVPLVGFVRMIIHSGKYNNGDRLTPDHEKTILERLLPYHPEFEKKIGCGIDYITVGLHPQFENSRCLFIVRKDGEMVDFSFWKCIKGLIKTNYPLYADSFILRHFRRRRQLE